MKDLLKLYSFESVHNTPDETAIADWICSWLNRNGIKDYTRNGNNIYRLSNKNKPILSAHLDQVRTNGKAVKFYMNEWEMIVAFNSKWERTSLGADDKNGVWVILKTLEKIKDINFIISEGEESGCIGIHKLESESVLSDNINESQYCIVLDRKGYSDMLKSGSCNTFCSTLAQSLCNYLKQDFTVTTGSLSDTCTLCNFCESVNMSVAYSNPHTSTEMTDFKRLKEIKDMVIDVVQNFKHYSTPPSVYKTSTTSYTYNYGGKRNGKEYYWDY